MSCESGLDRIPFIIKVEWQLDSEDDSIAQRELRLLGTEVHCMFCYESSFILLANK
jgi:hypothetical protein